MKTRECSKANAVVIRGRAEGTDLVKGWKVKNYDTEEDIDSLKQNFKLRRQGRYSGRKQGDEKKKCKICNLDYIKGEA